MGLWLVLRGKGAQTSAEVIFFPFFLGGMSQPGFCYYGEGENGCQGEPQIDAGIYWKETTPKVFSLARFADISVMSAIKKEEGSNLFIQHASLDPPSCFVQSISVT